MAKEIIERDATSQIIHVFIPDSSSTTGAGKTGLTNATSGLAVSVVRPGDASATVYSVAGSTIETISTLGTYAAPTATKCRFKEFDATNLPGVYELHFSDALFNSTGSRRSLVGMIFGASNVAPTPFQIQLIDSVRGLGSPTAIPNVASGNAGAIITAGTGTAQISLSSGQTTVATNNDKTGYSLTTTPPTAATIASAVRTELNTELGRIDVSTSTRLASADSGEIADAVVEALGTEIIVNEFTSDALAQISSIRTVEVEGPVLRQGAISLIQGDDYLTVDGRQLQFTNSNGSWADLTDAEITLYITHGTKQVSASGTVIHPTGVSQRVDVDLTRTNTASLAKGAWDYQLKAVLDDASEITLEFGTATIQRNLQLEN